jgi:3-deoxy-D-manno-octulosonic-acid transferase
VALAPFDTGGAAARLIARVQPRAHVIVESELWPTRMAALEKAKVPIIVLGARLSTRSAARWGMARGLIAGMLRHVSYLSAQDAASEARFLALGLPPSTLGPRVNLKAFVPDGEPAIGPVPRARCLLAASTHTGEDAPILQAFNVAQAAGLFDLLILAPRHPKRGDDVAKLIAAEGLTFARRSKGDALSGAHPVYLADTVGEMDQWYAMAGVTIVGGSYANHGGHTPFEPAVAGSAIIHGPHVTNFIDSYAALDAAGGAVTGDLTPAVLGMTPASQAELATIARRVLAPQGNLMDLVETIRQLAKGAE